MVAKPRSRKIDARIPRARGLRRNMTDAERKLWWHLRQLPMENSHFRRQATIGPYFVDFACHEQRIVIEVDGGQHAASDRAVADLRRTNFWNARGYRVLRLWNNEVSTEIEGVMTVIYHALNEPPAPLPPTPAREGARHPSPPLARARGGRGKVSAGRRSRAREHGE